MQGAIQRIQMDTGTPDTSTRSNSRSSDMAQLHDQSRKFVEQAAGMT